MKKKKALHPYSITIFSQQFFSTQKTNERMMAKTILRETKRGRPKKAQKTHNPKGPKRGRQDTKLFHPWPL
jgi:hypothetical protein